jgi:DNA-binding NarL/FixJ family response regulator
MIKTIVADPHPVFLLGMEQLLSSETDFALLSCCTTKEEALRQIEEQPPDLLILNPLLRDRTGLELIRDIKEKKLPIRVVVLAAALDDEQTIEIMRLGVQGMLLKSMPAALLLQCLRKIAAGEQWLEQKSLSRALEKLLHREAGIRRIATILTEREIEIMHLVAQGLSNLEIGERLVIGEGTVKAHVHNIYSKLGIKNRVDLTLYAQKKGLT